MDATSENDGSETANNAKQNANETSALETTNDSQEMQCHAYEFMHQHSFTEVKKQDQLSSYQTLLPKSISLNKPDDVIENGKQYLKLAKELGDKEAEKTALLSIGQACLSTNRYKDAILHCEECQQIASSTSDRHVEMRACLMLSKAYAAIHHYNLAISRGNKCIDLAKETGDIEVEMNAYLEIGNAYRLLDQHDDVELYCSKSLEMAKEANDKLVERRAYLVLALASPSISQIVKAGQDIRKSNDNTGLHLEQEASGEQQFNSNYQFDQEKHLESLLVELISRSLNLPYLSDDENSDNVSEMAITEMYKCWSLACEHYDDGNYDEAIKHAVKAINIAQEIGDKQTEMNACIVISESYRQLEQYNNVIVYGKRWLQLANELDHQSQITACCLLAIAYDSKSQYSESFSYNKKCLELATQSDDKSLATKALYSMGNSQYELDQYDDVVKYCMESLQMANEIDDSELAMKSCIILSKAYNSLEQYSDAYTFAMKVFEICKSMGDKKSEIRACFELGKVLAVLGNYHESIKYLMIVINYCETVADKDMELGAYTRLVDCFNNLNQHGKVLYYTTLRAKSLKIYQYHEDILSKIIHELDWFHAFTSVRDNVNDMDGLNDNTITNIVSLLHSSISHELNQQYEMAIECLNDILLIELDSFQALKNFCAHWEIARIYTLQYDIDKAIEQYQVALSYAKQCTCNHDFSLFCYEKLGILYLTQNENKKAVLFLQNAIQHGDAFLDQLYNEDSAYSRWDDLKITFHNSQIRCYKLLAKTLIESGNHQDGLMQLEHSRGRVLMEKLMDKYGMKRDSATKYHSLQQCEDIESLLPTNKYTIIVYFVSKDNLYTFLVQYKKELQVIQKSINDYEQYFQSLVEMCYSEMKLREDARCENRSLDSLFDKDTSQVQDDVYFKSVQFPEISLSGAKARGQSSEGNSGNDVSSCVLEFEELYNTLFQGSQIDQDEIVIIPDGYLYKVPFPALRNPQTGRYLIESKRIRIISSIAALKILNEKTTSQPYNGALIIGNPQVGKVMFNRREIQIRDLVDAEWEANAVAYALNVPGQCLIGSDATKAAVLDKLKQGVSVIHIAAHGFLEKSTIALAPSPEVRARRTPIERDYMLTMADVQDCHIDAQLVVLSCCHSGRGEIRAEGVVGMCRAFLASGARAVVASLWAIDDEFTCDFMYKFYGYLKKGYSASESLQMAMKDFMKNERYSHPKYWAPFFLMGDDVKIQF